jgi:hypothetical protein
MFRSWQRKLSWKHGHRDSKAGRAYYCPWWACEADYELAYLVGEPKRITSPPANIYFRPVEISASTDAYDYEIEDSPYWPPPAPPPRPKLSPEEEAERERILSCPAYIVLPCWIFHKNDPDPWPSRLHGHHNERPLKLDAVTGFIYSIKTRERVQTLRPKELMRIQLSLMNSKDFADRARALIGHV